MVWSVFIFLCVFSFLISLTEDDGITIEDIMREKGEHLTRTSVDELSFKRMQKDLDKDAKSNNSE